MHEAIQEILIDTQTLQQKIKDLAKQLSNDYKDKNPIMLCVLKGAVLFMSDLIKEIDIDLQIDFMSISSYSGEVTSSGVVKIIKDLDIQITGRDVVIVEDILDTGLTLDYLIRMLEEREPNSMKICSLLVKKKITGEQMKVKVDYQGFEIEDEFVVGYGLDYAEQFRNLPYIGILKKSYYQS